MMFVCNFSTQELLRWTPFCDDLFI